MAEKSFLDNFTPKQAFVMGIVLTVLALGTLGFLYNLKGGSLSLGEKSGNRGAAPAPTAVAPTPSQPTAAPTADARPVDDTDHIRGNVDAPITIIEYSDFECPFCGRFHPTMNQVVANNDDVNWVYRHFPLSSIHPNAQKAAEASECAADQGKFWEMADEMIENQAAGLSRAQLSTYAGNIGLNVSTFDDCVDSGKYAQKVAADAADGQGAGATGTPFSVIVADGQQIPVSGAVPLTQIESIIASLR